VVDGNPLLSQPVATTVSTRCWRTLLKAAVDGSSARDTTVLRALLLLSTLVVPNVGRRTLSDESSAGSHLQLRIYPDDVLRKLALPVEEGQVDEELEQLARGMVKTMYDEAGVGLAAPQVGVSLRMIVIDGSRERDKPIVMINPVIVDATGREVDEEGCLSVPGVRAKVKRHDRLTVEYETLSGEKAGFEAEGLLARIVQHEIDHLDGSLCVDRLGPAGRFAVRKALRELEKYGKE
jgi:peptide deformylase